MPKDTSAKVGMFFAILFLLALFAFIIGTVIASELLLSIGLITGIIFFLVGFIASIYNLIQYKMDPEKHKGKTKARLALFILVFGALVAAPFIIIYWKNNN